MVTPIIQVFANGSNITENLRDVLISVTITDSEGLTADTVALEIDDKDGSIVAPKTGAQIRVVGGYQGSLRDFGTFAVDTVSLRGWPQTISVQAKSVEAKKLAKQRESKAYRKHDYPTYGDVFDDVASGAGLQLAMDSSLKSLVNPYEAQTEESRLEFAMRLGEKIGAAVSVKSGRLVVVPRGDGKSAGGTSLQQVAVTKGVNLLSYSVDMQDEPKHKEVEATYYDREKNKREVVTESTGLEGPKYLLKAPFTDKGEAERAAKAKAKDLQRAQADATFEIDGSPFAQAEAYAVVSGIRPLVNGLWRVKTVTHVFSGSDAYKTTLQCETPTG